MSLPNHAPEMIDVDESFRRSRKPAADDLMLDECHDSPDDYEDAVEFLIPTQYGEK